MNNSNWGIERSFSFTCGIHANYCTVGDSG